MKITKEEWKENYKGRYFLKGGKVYQLNDAFVETKTEFHLFKDNTEYLKLTKVTYIDILDKTEYGIYWNVFI